MQELHFKFGSLDRFLEKNSDLIHEKAVSKLLKNDGENRVAVAGYRIVIPKIKSSFRFGVILELNENYDGSPCSDPWEATDDVYVRYGENETRVNSYISWSYDELLYAVLDACDDEDYPEELIDELDCILKFDQVKKPARETPKKSIPDENKPAKSIQKEKKSKAATNEDQYSLF